jgi:hypothetical protein
MEGLVAYKLMQKVVDTLGIPVMQKAVLIVLARHSLEDGTNAKSPSVQTLGDKAGMCAKAARVALRGLEEDGWIIALGNKAGGRKQTTRYLIVVGKLGPTETRNDVPGNEDETRYHVPGNGHDPAGETRYDSPLNTVPRTAEEVLEEKVSKESVCVVGVNPREAHTQGAPDSSEKKSAAKTNVVKFVPPSSPEVLPDGWVLPGEYRDYALAKGWADVDGAADRFRNHWLGKRDRGDRDAANTEAGWLRQWKGWINGNLKWERDHGKQRHNDQQRRVNGDLASYVQSHCAGWVADAAGGSNPW